MSKTFCLSYIIYQQVNSLISFQFAPNEIEIEIEIQFN